MGNITSSATNVACTGTGGNHPLGDCIVEYNTLATMPVNNFSYIIQASAGNRALTTPAEMAILDFSGTLSGTSRASGNFAWSNGVSNLMTITYNSSTRAIAYTLLNEVTSATATINGTLANATTLTDVFFKTQATTAGVTVKLSNITVAGTNFGAAQSEAVQSELSRQISYLWITGLTGSFTITTRMTMTWTGTAPSNTNDVAYIKFGQAINPSSYVPEPSSYLIAGSGLLLLLGINAGRRRRPRASPVQ